MRCGHPTCQRGIGLVSYRRGWFGKRLYCSRDCRDSYVAAEVRQPREPRPSRSFEPSLFEQLFAAATLPKPVPARAVIVRARAR